MKTNRFKDFTDEEIYMMQRTFTEAGFNVVMSDKYSKEQVEIYQKLYWEIIEEDKRRLYPEEPQETLEEYNRRMINIDYPDNPEEEEYPPADVNDRVFD